MLHEKEIWLKGFKELEYLEKGIYKEKNKKIPNKTIKPKITIDLSQLLLLEKYEKSINYDNINLEYDDVMISKNDIMNKEKISGNVSLVNEFPNALLLEESIFKKSDDKENIIESSDKNEILDTKEEDIWEILNQIKKENNSESFDILTTESDAKSDNITDDNESVERFYSCKGCGTKGSLIEDHHRSVIVCSDCGMINEELLDYGPEWRQYNNDDNRGEGVNRCGCPSNFFFPKSSQGTIMAGASNSRLKRKQKWNSMVYKERSLNQVFEYISTSCSKNNIPKIIIDSAKILYNRLSECKHKTGVNAGKQIIIRGENRQSIIAACVFKACEMNKNPRNVKEIAQIFGLDEKKVTKGNKQFDKIMKNADDNMLMLENFSSNTAEDYIRRHCPKLKINKSDTNMAVKIAHNCCKMKLASDHNPQAIAAGSILVMVQYYNLNIEKKNIASLFGTSDVTIGKIFNKIAPYVNALVNDEATEHLIKKFKING